MARVVADFDAKQAERAAQRLHSEFAKLGEQARVLDSNFARAEVGTQKMAKAQSTLDRALARGVIDQKEYNRLLGIAREKYTQAERSAAVYGRRLQALGTSMSQVGRSLTRMSTLIVGVGVVALKMSTDFSLAMTKIETLVGVNRQQVNAWRSDVLKLSGEVGRAPRELADALFYVTSAGLRGTTAFDTLRASAQGAAIGLGNTATIADAATSAMNAYGAANLSASRAVNIIALAVRAGKLEAESLAPTLGRLLPLASKLGIGFEQVAGTLAVMSRTGLGAEEAATSLQQVMTTLLGKSTGSRKALADVGLSFAQLRDVAQQPGGLIEAMRKIESATGDNDAAMVQIIPNIRALRGVMNVLAQDGSIVDDVMGQVASGTDVLGSGMKRLAEEPGFKFTQFLSDAKGKLIELGDELVPTFKVVLEWGGKLLKFVGSLVQGFSRLTDREQTVVVAFVGLAAALGPVLLVSGQIITAWGTLIPLATKLGTAIYGMTGPIGIVAAGLATLGLVAQSAIDRWREASERGISNIINWQEKARASVADLRKDLEDGVVDIKTFEAAENASARFGMAIQATKEHIADLKSQLAKLDTSNIAPDQLYIKQQNLNRSIEEETEKLHNQQAALNIVDKALLDASSATIKFDNATRKAASSAGGFSDSAKVVVNAVSPIPGIFGLASNAAAHAFKVFGGIDEPKKKLEEYQNSLSMLPGIFGLAAREANHAFKILGETDLKPPTDEHKKYVNDILKQFEEGYAKKQQAIMEEAWKNVQNIAADTLASIFKEWVHTGNKIADAFIEIIAQMLAKTLVLWAANAAKRIALERSVAAAGGTGSPGGGGGGLSGWSSILKGLGKLFGGGGSAAGGGTAVEADAVTLDAASTTGGSSSGLLAGGAAGALAIAAIWAGVIYYFHSTGAKRQAAKFSTGVQLGEGLKEVYGAAWSEELQKAALQAREYVRGLIKSIGANEESFPELRIEVQNSGKWFRAYIGDALVGSFKTYEEALKAATIEGIRSMDLTGVAPEIVQALQSGSIRSVDQLQEVAAVFAQINETANPVGKALDEVNAKLQQMTDVLDRAGISTDVLSSYTAQSLGAIRDQITGVTKSQAEIFEEQRKQFNAWVTQEKEKQQTALATAQAQKAAAEADVARLQALIAVAGTETRIYQNALENLATAQQALADSSSAIAQAQAALGALPDLIGPNEFHGGGGQGTRKRDLERLNEILDQFATDSLPAAQKAMVEFEKEWAGYRDLAHGNADALARLNDEMERQHQNLVDQLVNDVYGSIRQFESPDKSQFGQGIDAITQQADDLKEKFLDLAQALDFGSDRIAKGLGRIAAAEERRIQSLAQGEAQDLLLSLQDFLGMSEDSERLRFELSKAELQIRYAELQAAVQQYNLQIDYLDQIGALVGDLADFNYDDWVAAHRQATPAVRNLGSAANAAADAAKQMADRLANAKKGIGDFLSSLATGAEGGVSPKQALAAARAQFMAIRSEALSGNIQALEQFPQIAKTFLDLARQVNASNPEFQRIFNLVQQTGIDLMGVSRVTSDNVIFDQRFFDNQRSIQQAITAGNSNNVTALRMSTEEQTSVSRSGFANVVAAVTKNTANLDSRLARIEASLGSVNDANQRRKATA